MSSAITCSVSMVEKVFYKPLLMVRVDLSWSVPRDRGRFSLNPSAEHTCSLIRESPLDLLFDSLQVVNFKQHIPMQVRTWWWWKSQSENNNGQICHISELRSHIDYEISTEVHIVSFSLCSY